MNRGCNHGIVQSGGLTLLVDATASATTAGEWSVNRAYFILPGAFEIDRVGAGKNAIWFVGYKATFAKVICNTDHENILSRFQNIRGQMISSLRVLISSIANALAIDI